MVGFQLQNFARVSVSFNEEITDLVDTSLVNTTVFPHTPYKVDSRGCFRAYNYISKTYPTPTVGSSQAVATGDTQAQIFTWPTGGGSATNSGYFDQVVNDLQVGDIINVRSAADNSYVTYQVSAINSSNPLVQISMINGNYYTYVSPTITANQIAHMNTVPIPLISGIPNYIIVINNVIMQSSAGATYATCFPYLGYYSLNGATPAFLTTASIADNLDSSLLDGRGSIAIQVGGMSDITNYFQYDAVQGCGVYLTCTNTPGTTGTQKLRLTVNYTLYPYLTF